MTHSQRNPWQTLATRVRFENPWIRVIQNDVINPSGGPGEYTVVHFRNRAVAAIPVDDQRYTWLVGQYRYATETFEWEIPEGGAPEGESTLDCAKRELREETGLVAASWELVSSDVQMSNSVTNERAFTYLARELTQAEACPEDTEQLHIRRLPLSEAVAMAVSGEIRDAFSIISLLRLQHQIDRGEVQV